MPRDKGADLIQNWPAPSVPKPVVLIGAGGIVRDAHLPAYKRAEITVAGVTDIDPERAQKLADDWSIGKTYPDVGAAVADAGTGVIYDVAVPPHVISAILPALPDGAAVLMQKPMGADQEQARAIRGICRQKGLKAAVNFQLRFSPMMMVACQMIEKGRIGDLLEIEVHLNIFTPWHLFGFLIPMERVEIAVHSIHYLDTIRALAGNPKGVFARSMADPRAPEFAQTRTSVIFDYDEPLRAIMTINHNHQGGRRFQSAWFRIEGTEGAMMVKLGVCFDYPKGEADELWFCPNGGEWEQIGLEGAWFVDAFMGTMRNVQRFDAGEDCALFASVEDAYETMALAEACFEAMKAPATPLVLD
jgi:predicted dehydrogenase